MMNALEERLSKIDGNLYSRFQEAKTEIELLLGKYASNFPTYTDHSSHHTLEVFKIASELLSDDEIANLNADETYVLSMSCLLHDVGMCIPEHKIKELAESESILEYKQSHPNLSVEEYIRDIHHQLSKSFILEEWEALKIPTLKYAKAIAIAAEGHRKVDLGNFQIFDPKYFCKSGKEFTCLPYLASILRIADELDVTNSRTPRLLTKYYLPNNEVSIREWKKHISTSQRNYLDEKVIYEVDCSDQNVYAALQQQFEKIQNVTNYCQKIIRSIPHTKVKEYVLRLSLVDVKYNFDGFHPKGIKFSFDVQNVVTAFIGEDLYKDKLTSLREAVQNSIDSCRYKSKVLKQVFSPSIKVWVHDDYLQISDNGVGMDEFIIENFFARLASSFYEQEKVKSQFEAIGQFGVGVFSYFLISEYIDIQTKTDKGDPLRFRFDKDPKSYFHFYDKMEQTLSGTIITMYLKKELVGRLNFSNIEKYLRKIFKHIEIPIEVANQNNSVVIENQSFMIDGHNEIRKRLELQERVLADKLTTFINTIDDDEIEGTCAIIVGADYLKTFAYECRDFDNDLFRSKGYKNRYSQISISQKGVFVNNYSSPCIRLVIGDINLKRKVKINIDRNEFSDERQIEAIIQRFDVKLLKNIFCTLEEKYKTEEDRLVITKTFLFNYFIYESPTISKELWKLILGSLKLKVFLDNQERIVTFLDLRNYVDEIVLLSDTESPIGKDTGFHLPITIAQELGYLVNFDAIARIFMYLEFYQYIIQEGGCYYKKFSKEPYGVSNTEALEKLGNLFNSNFPTVTLSMVGSAKLLIGIWKNKKSFYSSGHFHFNYSHPFVQYVSENHIEIEENTNYTKIVKAALSMLIFAFKHDEVNAVLIEQVNEILNPLNEIYPLPEITLDDF